MVERDVRGKWPPCEYGHALFVVSMLTAVHGGVSAAVDVFRNSVLSYFDLMYFLL